MRVPLAKEIARRPNAFGLLLPLNQLWTVDSGRLIAVAVAGTPPQDRMTWRKRAENRAPPGGMRLRRLPLLLRTFIVIAPDRFGEDLKGAIDMRTLGVLVSLEEHRRAMFDAAQCYI
jgi:hypothetical protein